MASSLRNSSAITPDMSLPNGSLRMAKADIDQTTALSPLIKEAARRTHGKQEAAARHIGKQPSNFSRDVDSGDLRLRDLEALGPAFCAELGQALVERYGPLSDPKARARQLCDEVQASVNELRQFIEAA